MLTRRDIEAQTNWLRVYDDFIHRNPPLWAVEEHRFNSPSLYHREIGLFWVHVNGKAVIEAKCEQVLGPRLPIERGDLVVKQDA